MTDVGMTVQAINKVKEGRPHIVDLIKNGEISFIINTTEGAQAIADSYEIRRTALQYKVYNTTTIAGARACVAAVKSQRGGQTSVNRLQTLHERDVIAGN